MSEQIIETARVEQVEYRDIPGFPGYRVGNDGSVWTCRERYYPAGPKGTGVRYRLGHKWVCMKLHLTNLLYLNVQLYRDGRMYYKLVHRLVLESFIGPCPEGMEACHNERNPSDNRLSGLRWDTKKNNQADRVRHGTHNRGQRHGNACLTDAQASVIRVRASRGESKAAIAREFGVSRYVVSDVARGVTYK